MVLIHNYEKLATKFNQKTNLKPRLSAVLLPFEVSNSKTNFLRASYTVLCTKQVNDYMCQDRDMFAKFLLLAVTEILEITSKHINPLKKSMQFIPTLTYHMDAIATQFHSIIMEH